MAVDHRDLLGRELLAADGVRLGHVADVYVDPDTGAARWLVVRTGVLADRVCFVPADGAREDEDHRLVAAYRRKQIRRAPHPAADGALDAAEEAALARHYLAMADDAGGSGSMAAAAAARPAAAPQVEDRTQELLSGPIGPDDTTTIRAEEEVDATVVALPIRRSRLVKRVVTEQVTITVPVRREVLELVHEELPPGAEVAPSSAGEPFAPAPDQEFLLYAEVVDYSTRIVPKERVRLVREVVPEVVDLTVDLRREHVEAEESAPAR
jgi:sporulation protein YlmC with PRC-barrel domain